MKAFLKRILEHHWIRYGLAVVMAVFAASTMILWARDRSEPHYHGKSLSYWLEVNLNKTVTGGKEKEEAGSAIRAIGTNGIPFMLEMLRKKDTGLKALIFSKFSNAWLAHYVMTPAWLQNARASCGFTELSTNASSALPDLITIFEENISPNSLINTVSAIVTIGPSATNAIPAFVRGLTNSSANVHFYSAYGLSRIDEPSTLRVSALIDCMGDADKFIKKNAVYGLARIGPQAASALPALSKEAENTISPIRVDAIYAIGEIHQSGQTCVPVLRHCLQDKNPLIRQNAARGLGRFGGEAKTALNELRLLENDPDKAVREAAHESIKDIGQ